MKKSLLWIVVLVLSISMVVAFSLASCKTTTTTETTAAVTTAGTGETTAAAETTAAVAKTQLVYNSYASDPEPRRVDELVVSMFEAKYPNIDVIHSIVAHEDFKQAIRAYLTSSTPPDVLTWFAGNRARFFVDKGLIMDISDLWASEGWNDNYPKGFKALSSVGDKQYFLPTSYYWWAVYYNKAVFAKYNLQIPKTWDEFLTVCETLKSNGVTPITIGTKAPWTAAAWFDMLNMRTNGPEFHINLMLGTEKYDDPRVKKTFENWKVLLDKGYFNADAASYQWQEVVPDLISGKAAMYLMGQFIMDSIPEANRGDFDFFRFPSIDPSALIGEDAPTDGYFVAANAPHPEEAKLFMGYLGSKEIQEILMKELGRMPTNTLVDTSLFTPQQQEGMDLMKGSDYVAQFYDRDTTPEMAEKGMAAMQEFWADTNKIDSILTQLEKDRALIFVPET